MTQRRRMKCILHSISKYLVAGCCASITFKVTDLLQALFNCVFWTAASTDILSHRAVSLQQQSRAACYAPAVQGSVKRYRDPSVCLSHGAAALGAQLPQSVGTLAACSLPTAGHQRCADCGSVRGRTQIRRESNCHRRTAYRLAAPGAITCSLWLAVSDATSVQGAARIF